MIKFPAFMLAAILAAPAIAAPSAKLPALEDQVHCALVFGEITRQQSSGVPGADRFPVMAKSGREFFVRTGARSLDDKATTIEGIEAYFVSRLGTLQDSLAKATDPGAALDREYAACVPQFAAVAPEFTPPAR
ncbi:MAG: hypothetical protein ACKOOL_00500 [Novosphingobium sp.]